LAGRDAADLGLRGRPRAGGPRGRHVRGGGRRLMALKTFIEAIRETLSEEMRRDESVIVLGEDVGLKGGVFLATDGLYGEFGEDRVIDTPLTESMIIGTSIGAAMNGLRPVAEIQFADFIHPAFNQLVSEAARMRYRSNNGFGVPMTVRAPYGGGVHGALYHSQSVEAFFAHVPGPKVVIPSTPCSSASTRRCTGRSAATCRPVITSSRSARLRSPIPAPRSRSSPTGSWPTTPSRRPTSLRRRGSASRSSTSGRCGPSTRRPSSARYGRPASA